MSCQHDPLSGDEGPVAELGRMPTRWKCDECGTIVNDQFLGKIEAAIAAKFTTDLSYRAPSRVCPDPVNLDYDDHRWFIPSWGRVRPPSDFMRIARTAQRSGWTIHYIDQGIGHDRHVLAHSGRNLVMEVGYRSATAVWATLSGGGRQNPLKLDRVLKTLLGDAWCERPERQK